MHRSRRQPPRTEPPTPRSRRSSESRAGRYLRGLLTLAIFGLALVVWAKPAPPKSESLHLPWRAAGWSERQAAAHLLDRLAYGARPGDIDRLVAMGLDHWVEQQLRADEPDDALDDRLKSLRSLGLSPREASERYPDPAMMLRLADRDGAIDRGALETMVESFQSGEPMDSGNRFESRRQVMEWAEDQGFRPQRELLGETMVAKLGRAVYSENQLAAVLTDFWFNHFNVSLTDNEARVYIPSYERDAIAPHVLGSFRTMLEATAKHPAMLHYLDNIRSVADEGQPTTFDRERFEARRRERRGRGLGGRGRGGFGGRDATLAGLDDATRRRLEERRPQGLNENYARELMELHTLGVDGGYTQDDVIEVARAFTGWATYPSGPARREVEQRIALAKRTPGAGFVFEESFLFRADVHDAGPKTVLGHTLAADRGIEDGLEVLDLLARHPATAHHLARKLAVRFVTDDPPETLIQRLADVYLDHDGALRPVMEALVESPEFWDPATRRAKIKTPFELVASTLRATDAEIRDPRSLVEWLRRLGQMPYAYQAPTGYPDDAASWVNSGALLERMNFGLQFATGRLPGVSLDLPALDRNREPESLDHALATYIPLLLPERDPEEALARLIPVIRDPDLARKIEQAAPADEGTGFADDAFFGLGSPGRERDRGRGPFGRRPTPPIEPDNSPLAQVVGVILGSPEFQRR